MATVRELKERYGLVESVPETTEDEETGDTLPKDVDGRNYALDVLKNTPGSAARLGRDIITPFLQPITTAKNITQLGSSLLSLIKPGEQGNEQLARDVGAYYKQRYGEDFGETLRTDPVGVLGDVALFINAGGGVARLTTKAAGSSKAIARQKEALKSNKEVTTKDKRLISADERARKISEAGRIIDPVSLAARAAAKPIKGGAKLVGTVQGLASGVSRSPLDELASNSPEATRAMRGDFSQDEILITANQGLKSLKEENSKYFQAERSKLFSAKQRNKKVSKKTKDEIRKVLSDYKSSNRILPNQPLSNTVKNIENNYLTGLDDVDNLGQLDSFRSDFYQIEFPSGNPKATQAYSKIRKDIADIINKQMPQGYTEFLTEYGKSLGIVDEITKELGLGTTRSKQAVLNKLVRAAREEGSIINRILKELPDKNVVPRLLGLAVNPTFPGGLARSLTAGAFGAGLGGFGLAALAPALTGLGLVSPRLGGEAALLAGRINRGAGKVAPATRGLLAGSRQVGSLQNQGILNNKE